MRLGIDIGTNSIGWWLYETRNGEITSVIDGGVRIFSDGRDPKSGTSLAVDRRNARSMRRRRDRYLRRRSSLMKKLVDAGLMPVDSAEAKELASLDPYALRAKALDCALPLTHVGRAIFHLNQRRGFKSNRKTDKGDNEGGLIKEAVARLDQAMMSVGARTYGEFLHKRRQPESGANGPMPVRTRLTTTVQEGDAKEKAKYDFYPDRRHLMEEFEKIWSAQARYHPEVLSDELKEVIGQTIFFQRPLKQPKVGRCLLCDEERLPKAHPLTARRVLLETVNSLRVKTVGEPSRPLTRTERDLIVSALDNKKHTKSMSGMSMKLTTLRRVVALSPDESFTLETVNRDSIKCDQVLASLSHPDRFGTRWTRMTADDQWGIIERLRTEESPEELIGWLRDRYGLDQAIAENVAGAPLPEGFSRIGETATRRILEKLESDVLTYSGAVDACGWSHSDFRTGEVFDKLPYYGQVLDRHVIPGTQEPRHDDIERFGRITNPTVHIGLNQLRRLVNKIIGVYGKPDQIVVEVARELKQSSEQKKETQYRLKKNTEAAISRGQKLEELGVANSGGNRMRLRLWEELGKDPMMRFCPYSGQRISVSMLFNGSCDEDHILPYSRTLDDSPANRTLCIMEANREKRNRTPWEAWGGDPERWDAIAANLSSLPENKQWRFSQDAMTRFEKNRGFLDRALVDTQYLSRLTRTYLESLFSDERQHVWVIPGRLTEMLRRHWGLNSLLGDRDKGADKPKNRTDHRHHAIDAAVVAATDRSLLQRISRAASRGEEQGAEHVARKTDPPWEGFRSDIDAQLKRIVVSHRADHGRIDNSVRSSGRDSTSAQLHNETAYGLTGLTKGDVSLVVSRKPLDQLDAKSLEKIRDPYLKRELMAVTQGKEKKDFTKALIDYANNSVRYRGMRRVRLIEPLNVIEIRDRNGHAYKGYKPDSNCCYEVWELPDGQWKQQVLTTFEVHQSAVTKKPHPAAKRIMRLYKKDMVFLTHPKHGEFFATVAQLSNQRLDLVPNNEANADARSRDRSDPFSFVRVTVGKLKEYKLRRVHVDEMGVVRDPGPYLD